MNQFGLERGIINIFKKRNILNLMLLAIVMKVYLMGVGKNNFDDTLEYKLIVLSFSMFQSVVIFFIWK